MRKHLLLIFVLIIIVIGLVLLLPKHVEKLDPETVVAIVYGQNIKYSSIQVTVDHPAIQYKIQEGMLTEEQLPDYILKKEKENLIAQINDIILWKAIEESDLIVTQDEINNHIDKILASMTASELNEAYEKTKLLVKAVREALDFSERADEIYKSLLEPHGIPYDGWRQTLEQFTAIEELNKFEANLEQVFTREHIRKQYEEYTEGFRKTILRRKFFEYLVNDISVSDSEVIQLYNKRCPGGRIAFDDVKENLYNEIYRGKKLKRLKKWQQEGIENANISIKVNKFRSIVNEMLERTERAVYVGP